VGDPDEQGASVSGGEDLALKIALATGGFRPGRYTRTSAGSNDWTRE
jgi:hypothetical protein